MKSYTNTENLIKHISKLQGQLDAVKRELENSAPDCNKASDTLYAASRSFASVRALFVKCFLTKEFIKNNGDENKLDRLLTLIKG